MDYLSLPALLAVELDGPYHNRPGCWVSVPGIPTLQWQRAQPDRDARRDKYLHQRFGVRVIRVRTVDMFNLAAMKRKIDEIHQRAKRRIAARKRAGIPELILAAAIPTTAPAAQAAQERKHRNKNKLNPAFTAAESAIAPKPIAVESSIARRIATEEALALSAWLQGQPVPEPGFLTRQDGQGRDGQ